MFVSIRKCDSEEIYEQMKRELTLTDNDCIVKRLALLEEKKQKRQKMAATYALYENMKAANILDVCLDYQVDQEGKPYFANKREYYFSNSHSGDYGMNCLGTEPVGCDMEAMKSGREKVANRFFSAEENLLLQLAGEEERSLLFFKLWTMKESYVKLKGCGLRIPLDSIQIQMDQTGQIAYISSPYYDRDCVGKWYSVLCPQYMVAVCVEGSVDMLPDIL